MVQTKNCNDISLVFTNGTIAMEQEQPYPQAM